MGIDAGLVMVSNVNVYKKKEKASHGLQINKKKNYKKAMRKMYMTTDASHLYAPAPSYSRFS